MIVISTALDLRSLATERTQEVERSLDKLEMTYYLDLIEG